MEIFAKSQRLTLQINNVLFNHARPMASTEFERSTDSDDTVDLSSGGTAAGSALGHLEHVPETRADKVAALRQRIAAGSYRIDGEQLATDLMTEAGENNTILKQMDIDA